MHHYLLPLLTITLLLFGFSFAKEEEGNQQALYECTQPMDIDSSLFDVKPGKIYFHFNKKLKPKDLKSKGFLWQEDAPKGYFTAYLINAGDTTFHAPRQDGSLIMIQEAMNENGEWKPIEFWVYSGCGNSYFDPLELEPGKYVMIPLKEYKGSFKTKIRLKMKKGKSIFYSEPFEGSINKSQFKEETRMLEGILYTGPASYLNEE